MNLKYITLLLISLGFTACNDLEDINREEPEVFLPELTSGTADFSNYIAVGGSFTAGFTDGALFKASQENAFPNILASKFALINGSEFNQPLMNDNVGGLLFGGIPNSDFGPRYYFYSDVDPSDNYDSGPYLLGVVPHQLDFTPEIPTTEVMTILTGPFHNMGVPGIKISHLVFEGYGNPGGLLTSPASANPYFVRMASSTSASVLGDIMAQNPTFFTLSEIGGNDVLGFALSGGDGSEAITPIDGPVGEGFNATFEYIISTLTSNGAKGVVTNVPYVKDLPHFTTVPHNPIPLDAATATYLNSALAYGAYNAGIINAFDYLIGNGLISQKEADAEIARRTITFEASETNAVVIIDENLTDLTGLNPNLISMRQATAKDLLVLTASTFIGTEAVPGNPQTINGVAIPLADKWVLTPEEQEAITTTTDAYNATIASIVNDNENITLLDLNAMLTELATTGIVFDDYILNANLVTGGAIGLDGVHLTARGYAYLANKFLETIDSAFGSNFMASGNISKAGDYPTNYPATLQ